ncbi:MAG: ABC transporter ATP-binding protein [Pseudomonadota bacterium]
MLTARAVETYYGTSQALFGVDIAVDEGQLVALLGRNGMGKTTTIRTICGLNRASSGDIRFLDQDLTTLPPYRIAQLGIGLVPEGRRCFATLTVYENLVATARSDTSGQTRWDLDAVFRLFPRLAERTSQRAATLSGGEQQMLAIGRALMTNPKLLILDEATEGLAPLIRQEIWSVIRELKAARQSILIVDKSLSEVLPIADQCVILEKGRSVWHGSASDFEASERQLSRYLAL